MTPERYAALAALAGEWLLEHRDMPVPVGERSGCEQRGVYIAVDVQGRACYAGKTRPQLRPAAALAGRVRQHQTEPSKRAEWAAYWALPLRSDTPPWAVDRLEVDVCARLGLPLRNRRWRARAARGG